MRIDGNTQPIDGGPGSDIPGGLASIAQLMVLDEPGHRHITKLVREDWRTCHLGAELGVGETEREGERGATDRQS